MMPRQFIYSNFPICCRSSAELEMLNRQWWFPDGDEWIFLRPCLVICLWPASSACSSSWRLWSHGHVFKPLRLCPFWTKRLRPLPSPHNETFLPPYVPVWIYNKTNHKTRYANMCKALYHVLCHLSLYNFMYFSWISLKKCTIVFIGITSLKSLQWLKSTNLRVIIKGVMNEL